MGTPVLIRNHSLKDVRPAEGKMLVKLHGAKSNVAVPNPDELEPEGEVVAVGPGYRLPDGINHATPPVSIGEMVMIGRAQVTPIKVDGQVMYLLPFSAIEAITGRKGVSEGTVEKPTGLLLPKLSG